MNPTPSTAAPDTANTSDIPVVTVPQRNRSELFLEALQRRVYSAVGITAEECQHREWIGQQTILPVRLQQKAEQLSPSEFAHYRAAVLDALTRDELLPRPTAFERPHQYSILRGLKVSVEDALNDLAIPLPFRPVVGTLPTRLLEPLMVRVPGTEEVVLLVDGGLLTYVHLLAKAIAHALPPEVWDGDMMEVGEGDWDGPFDPEGVATQRFIELMMAAVNGAPASAPMYAPKASCEQTTAALCECMELFIIGREYARLAEGHHLVAGTEPRQAFGQTFEALVWTASQELHADALGFGLMLAAAGSKGESARLAYWSADVLLASFGIIERAIMALQSPVGVPMVALPPTIFDERRTQLQQLVRQLEGGDRALAFAAALDPVVRGLAERFEMVLQDARPGAGQIH